MVRQDGSAGRAASGKVPVGILAALLAFGLVTKAVRLGDPPGYYLDEVYHAFTAREYLHGHPQAYDPWAKPPPGVAYEWTHPPLAKLLMAGGMAVFGENAVGWRVGSVLAGTAATGAAALLGFELFASPAVAVLTAALLDVEGLFFVQSRVAMNDAYFVLFALLSVLGYVRWRRTGRTAALAWAGAALGLAAASKWTALYVLAIFGVERLASWAAALARERRWPRPSEPALLALFLVAVPAAIYVASYAQYFLMGHGLHDFTALQQQMWWYHTGLKATHPYQSRPWQWLLDLRPVWMYTRQAGGGRVANIYNLGNPVVLLAGLAAAVAALLERRMDWPRAFALLGWLMLWLPWTLSPRIMLFYHYMPAVPFLCILLARALARAWERGRRRAVGAILGLAVAWFAFTYPHLTAVPLPARFVDRAYYLVPSWR